MLNIVDNFLNAITMYRLVLYYLIFLLLVALVFSLFGILPFGPISLTVSTLVLLGVGYGTNKILGKIFGAITNLESVYISVLILALIITPIKSLAGIPFLVFAAILTMASKYILTIHRKHMFNPVAIALVITGLTSIGYASWWIGTLCMFPFVLTGILIVRKIRRFDLVFYFVIASVITTFMVAFTRGNMNPVTILKGMFIDSPLLFFAFVMLTEPLTTPPTAVLQSIYGGLVGILFSPVHVGSFFISPEMALAIGNVFSYIVSPKEKLILKLKEKVKLAQNVYDFIFTSSEKLDFIAGQYLEWTLGHKNPDARGNRRYFTVASSPTEADIRIGVKFADNSSSFKKEMLGMRLGSKIVASQLSGEFTLMKDKNQKLVFIAGGIGVTPYRSIVKYLIDTGEKRDIVLLYTDRNEADMVYKQVFDEGVKKIGMKVWYVATSKEGRITTDMIKDKIPDYKERFFYISGSHGMVTGFEKLMEEMKLPKGQLKVDYFPGF